MNLVLTILLVLGMVTVPIMPSSCLADISSTDNARARQLMIEGTRLQLKGDFQGAIKKYSQSLKLKPNPNLEGLVQRLQKHEARKNSASELQHSSRPATTATAQADEEQFLRIPSGPAPSIPISTPDFSKLDLLATTNTITTTMNLLKQLYGKLSPKQEKILHAQFAQYYQYPCNEVIDYFNRLNKKLYMAVVLKTRLSAEMEGYGYAAGEMMNAYDYRNIQVARQATENLLRRRQNILAIQRQLSELNMHLDTTKKEPDAEKIRREKKEFFNNLLRDMESLDKKSGTVQNPAASVDGIWELDEEIIKTDSRPGNRFYREKLALSSLINTHSSSSLDFLSPFVSKRIYLKKVNEPENGYSLIYLYLYHDLTEGDPGIRAVADAVADVVAEAFGDDEDKGGGSKERSDDNYETLIFRQTGEHTFVMYSASRKYTIDVHGDSMECRIHIPGVNESSLYTLSFRRKKNPAHPPTLRNGSWSWKTLLDDYNEQLAIYRHLDAEQKNIPLQDLDEEDYESIRRLMALFRQNENEFSTLAGEFKGINPDTADSGSMVWQVDNVKVEIPHGAYSNPVYEDSGVTSTLEITHDASAGWIRIWKKEYRDDSADPGERYIPNPSMEAEPHLVKRYEVAKYSGPQYLDQHLRSDLAQNIG